MSIVFSVLCCIQFLTPFIFPLLYLVILPYFSSPLLSIYDSILSPMSMLTGSQTTERQISCPSISLHHESNRTSFAFIVPDFYGHGVLCGHHPALMPHVRSIHLAPETSVIYNSTLELNPQASLYR